MVRRTHLDAEIDSPLASFPERLALRDGSPVIIRLLEPDDRPLVEAVFEGMGEEMRHRRFLGYKKHLSVRDLETLTAVDHHRHEALAAVHAETAAPLGIGHAIQEPGRPDTAEASVEVVDAWHGRGLGGILLDRLVLRARAAGMRRFTAVLLTENVAMLRLFERAGAVRVTGRYGDSVEIAVELPFETGAPREALRAAAAGRVRG
jgi:GNAT superfamily N-acetyltransferase